MLCCVMLCCACKFYNLLWSNISRLLSNWLWLMVNKWFFVICRHIYRDTIIIIIIIIYTQIFYTISKFVVNRESCYMIRVFLRRRAHCETFMPIIKWNCNKIQSYIQSACAIFFFFVLFVLYLCVYILPQYSKWQFVAIKSSRRWYKMWARLFVCKHHDEYNIIILFYFFFLVPTRLSVSFSKRKSKKKNDKTRSIQMNCRWMSRTSWVYAMCSCMRKTTSVIFGRNKHCVTWKKQHVLRFYWETGWNKQKKKNTERTIDVRRKKRETREPPSSLNDKYHKTYNLLTVFLWTKPNNNYTTMRERKSQEKYRENAKQTLYITFYNKKK